MAPSAVVTPTGSIAEEIRRVVAAGDHLAALDRSAGFARQASQVDDPAEMATELGLVADEGVLPGLVAVEALSRVRHDRAGAILADLARDPRPLIRRHATWRLARRPPDLRAVGPLLDQLAEGGIDTMHAHRTLRRWSAARPAAILRATIDRLLVTDGPAERARLIDLVGVMADPGSDELLLHLASDTAEPSPARLAAIGALGDRRRAPVATTLRRLAALDDEAGDHAALALWDLAAPAHHHDHPGARGLRIAELTMAGGLDGQLSWGGRGETGGVASLLVSLAQALGRQPEVEHVLTIGRGNVADAVAGALSAAGTPTSFGTLAVGSQERPADGPDALWEHLPALERGLRRVLRRQGPVDLLHLRMADAGTLAGAEVAAEAGIGICFSLAHDPHNVLQSLQARGELDPPSFEHLEATTHVWFRARLVERLARRADRLALFPRSPTQGTGSDAGPALAPDPDPDPDPGPDDRRRAVVAEGIDIELLRRAEAEVAAEAELPARVHPEGAVALGVRAAGGVLDDVARSLPEGRRHLPLLVSVGRLHPVKGMDRVVAAWASDPALHRSCNLVVVGGHLEDPSPTERAVLDTIDRALPVDDPRRAGLVLAGGRPRAEVARLLVSAGRGLRDAWAPGGVYVDGALKEEFGLAVIEALAAGLVVVAPSTGGPPSYVDHGDTGVLVDPAAPLAAAIGHAFSLVHRPGRAARARAMVEQRYSIDTMAARLVELYRPTVALR